MEAILQNIFRKNLGFTFSCYVFDVKCSVLLVIEGRIYYEYNMEKNNFAESSQILLDYTGLKIILLD